MVSFARVVLHRTQHSTSSFIFWEFSEFLMAIRAKNNPRKKGVFRHFFENFNQKIAFFWRALPFQTLGSASQKCISKKVPKGGPEGK